MTVLDFVVALVVIVVASELFTNAIEWAGFRLKLASGATGSLLAALGTSLPETAVPIVALATGANGASQVAMGAVLGSPLMLLTLGMGITGTAVMARRNRTILDITPGQAHRDLGIFIIAFSLGLATMALPRALHYVVGPVLLLLYVVYVVMTLRGGSPSEEMPEPLHLMRWKADVESHDAAVVLQLALAVAALVWGSKLFVDGLTATATALHLPTLLLALVLTPFATELPETLNSVLWVRGNDDGLAFGNVAGSATFQSCILGFVGVTFTPWQPGGSGVLSGILTLLTAVGLLGLFRRGHAGGKLLLLAFVPWLVFIAAAIASGGNVGPAPG